MKWHINLYDTSTQPTEVMRAAMARAEVGDDVYQEDPTVNQLEAEASALVGKEAALFVPSGTMGNLVAMMAQTQHGDEVILEAQSHIYYYEAGGFSTLAGLVPRLVEGERGVLDPDRVRAVLRQPDIHYPPTSLLCVENTHNRAGGIITSPDTMRALRALADENGLHIHLDGARIFNAAVALNIPVTEFTSHADTVMFCLSKSLGAPVGSIVAGNQVLIEKARRMRKMLGGGMRQCGMLAAAGLLAIRGGISRLPEDHQNARKLAKGLSTIPQIRIDMNQVQTNFVMLDVQPSGMTAEQMSKALKSRGIKVSSRPPYTIRMVTHRNITPPMIEEVIEVVTEVVGEADRVSPGP